MEDSEAGLLNN